MFKYLSILKYLYIFHFFNFLEILLWNQVLINVSFYLI